MTNQFHQPTLATSPDIVGWPRTRQRLDQRWHQFFPAYLSCWQ